MYSLQPLKEEELVKLQAERLNCSLPTVKKYLKKYELIGAYVRTIPINMDELYKLRVECEWTYRELAELYQVADTTLRNRCEEFEFPEVHVGRQNNNWRLKPMVNKKIKNKKRVSKNTNKILKELYYIL